MCLLLVSLLAHHLFGFTPNPPTLLFFCFSRTYLKSNQSSVPAWLADDGNNFNIAILGHCTCDTCQALHDGGTYWSLYMCTILCSLDFISRSQWGQTFQSESCIAQQVPVWSNWNFLCCLVHWLDQAYNVILDFACIQGKKNLKHFHL